MYRLTTDWAGRAIRQQVSEKTPLVI
jgi:hypothetical protein